MTPVQRRWDADGDGWRSGWRWGRSREGVTGDAAGAAAENCKRNQQQKFPFR